MFLLLVVVFLLGWLIMQRWNRNPYEKLYKQMKKVPFWRLPLLGHLHEMLGDEEKMMQQVSRFGKEIIKVGGVSGTWVTYKLYIAVADPEVADIILKTCLEKDDVMNCFHMGTGDGSAFTSVKKWRPRRKFLAPTFSMTQLKRFAQIFYIHSQVLAAKLEEFAGKTPFSIWKMYSMYNIDAVLASLGFQGEAQKNDDHPLPVFVEELFHLAGFRAFRPWLYNDTVYSLLPSYRHLMKLKAAAVESIEKTIHGKRTSKEKSGLNANEVVPNIKTFIDLMIESGQSDLEIREECGIIMGATSDTSNIALSFASLLLAKYPQMQDKVYDELNQVRGGEDRPIRPEDLPHLKYLEAFIRETLRLYPPAPIIMRKIEKYIDLPSGITLVPGCGAAIHIWAINRNPKYWGEDAEQFRPARFLEPTQRHAAAFATFSHGPRNCIGYQYAMMSMKTVLANVLSQYRFLPASDDFMDKPLRIKYDIMLRHVDNYYVKIESRNKILKSS